jgi:hypothetical protein
VKRILLIVLVIVSIFLNIFFILRPKQMIVAVSSGWEGNFEEYSCLGKEVTQCASIKGESICRDYYCYGILIDKKCYQRKIEKGLDAKEYINKTEFPCYR